MQNIIFWLFKTLIINFKNVPWSWFLGVLIARSWIHLKNCDILDIYENYKNHFFWKTIEGKPKLKYFVHLNVLARVFSELFYVQT